MTIVDRSDTVALVRRHLAVLDELSVSLDHDPEVHLDISIRTQSGSLDIQVMPDPDNLTDAAELAERIWHGECSYEVREGETATHHIWSGEYGGLPLRIVTLIDYLPAPVAETVELAEQQQPAPWIGELSRRLVEAGVRAVAVVAAGSELHAACVRPEDWCEHGYATRACPVLDCCHSGPLDGDQPRAIDNACAGG